SAWRPAEVAAGAILSSATPSEYAPTWRAASSPWEAPSKTMAWCSIRSPSTWTRRQPTRRAAGALATRCSSTAVPAWRRLRPAGVPFSPRPRRGRGHRDLPPSPRPSPSKEGEGVIEEIHMDALIKQMNAMCDALPFQTSWYLKDLKSGRTADRMGDVSVPSASTRKISILMAALKAVHDGKLSLDQKVTIEARYQDNDSG